jgi:hypothetical protein
LEAQDASVNKGIIWAAGKEKNVEKQYNYDVINYFVKYGTHTIIVLKFRP